MKVGIQLPEIEREVRWPELAEMSRRIEAGGFDSIWVGDHLLYREDGEERGPWEAWSQLAAIAAITERVEIGPLVAATSFHSPAMLAKMASTVEEISNGRLILGLGAGWNEDEYRAFGFPFDRRASRFEEAFEIIRRLLAGERVDFDGRFYQVEQSVLLPRGSRKGGPPILIGSEGPRVLSITAPYMSMWNAWYSWYGNRPEGLPPLLAKVDAALEAAGRKTDEVSKTVAVLVGLEDAGSRRGLTGVEAEPLRGSVEQLAAALAGWQAYGIDHLQLVLEPITLDAIDTMAEVLDLLRQMSTDRQA